MSASMHIPPLALASPGTEPEPEPSIEPGPAPGAGLARALWPADEAALRRTFEEISSRAVGQRFDFMVPYDVVDGGELRRWPGLMLAARPHPELLRRMLDAVLHLSEGNLRNTHHLCDAGIVEVLISLCENLDSGVDVAGGLSSKVMTCLLTLSRHSMAASSLRWLLRAVVKLERGAAGAANRELLLLVLRQVLEKEGPSACVDMREHIAHGIQSLGTGSGVCMPPDKRGTVWPADSAMVLLWLRLEESDLVVPSSAEKISSGGRVIMSYISSDSTTGWQVSLREQEQDVRKSRRRQMKLRVTCTTASFVGSKRKFSLVDFDQWQMLDEQWYHVAIVHRKHALRRSSVRLYVNGKLQRPASSPTGSAEEEEGLSCGFPLVEAPITQCLLGNLSSTNRWGSRSCFEGQIGPVYLCEAVDGGKHDSCEKALSQLYEQGPDSLLWLDPLHARSDLTLRSAARKSNLQITVAHAFIPNVALTLIEQQEAAMADPQSTDSSLHLRETVLLRASDVDRDSNTSSEGGPSGKLLYPVSPRGTNLGHDAGGATVDPSWGGALVGNAVLLKSMAFKGSLESLGGPRVLVPLFALCENETDLSLLIKLLCEIFLTDETTRSTFAAANGFQLIAYLLSQSHLGGPLFGPKVVAAFRELSDTLPQNHEVWAQLMRHLLWFFPLWLYTAESVQAEHLELLMKWLRVDPERFRHVIGVQRLLDFVRLCYWDQENKEIQTRVPEQKPVPNSAVPAAAAVEPGSPKRSASKNVAVNVRVGRAKLAQFRGAVLKMIEVMVGEHITPVETRSLVRFAAECSDPVPVSEVLDIIGRLHQLPHPACLPIQLEELGGISLLCVCFERKSPDIDAAMMRLLAIYGASSNSGTKPVELEVLMRCATAQIADRTLTDAVFDAMLNSLFQHVSEDPRRHYSGTEDQNVLRKQARGSFFMDRPAFRVKGVLHCILDAAKMAPDGLRRRIVAELTPLLANEDYMTLKQRAGWQRPLIEMVSCCPPRAQEAESVTVGTDGVSIDTIAVVSKLLFRALACGFRDPEMSESKGNAGYVRTGGLVEWEETLSLMPMTQDALPPHRVLRQILCRMMVVECATVVESAPTHLEGQSLQIWTNVCNFLGSDICAAFAQPNIVPEPDPGSPDISGDFFDLLANLLMAIVKRFELSPSSRDYHTIGRIMTRGGETLLGIMLQHMKIASRSHRTDGQSDSDERFATEALVLRELEAAAAPAPDVEPMAVQQELLQLCNNSADKAREDEHAHVRELTDKFQTTASRLQRDEINRVTAELPRLHQRQAATVRSLMRQLFHELSGSKHSIYADLHGGSKQERPSYWKLDRMELKRGSRMRLRLKPDSKGDRHRLLREKLERAKQQQQQQQQQSEVPIGSTKSCMDSDVSNVDSPVHPPGPVNSGSDAAAAAAEWVLARAQSAQAEICQNVTESLDSGGSSRDFWDVDGWEGDIEDAHNNVGEMLQESRDDDADYWAKAGEVPEHVFMAHWVTPLRTIMGCFSITKTSFFFTAMDQADKVKEQRWPFRTIKEVQRRRYLMQHTALEFFFLDTTNCYMNFDLDGDSAKVVDLLKTRAPQLNQVQRCVFSEDQRNRRLSDLSEAWALGAIDNYHYLMKLNSLAGRTYSDLTQWPVFPWVISDYTSQTLDLASPHSFRDLSKPVGALNPERLARFKARAEGLRESSDDDDENYFLYGTHYSTAASILHYLVRLEPYASLHVQMQSGGSKRAKIGGVDDGPSQVATAAAFDMPDRLFHSIPDLWRACNSPDSLAEVKELTPEWFYLPDFLYDDANLGHLMGTRSDGTAIGDVILPPWAATPEDFIRLQREALESPYVSAHLHEWVDLIFGYKQRGKAADEADNLFYPLTYEPITESAKAKSQLQHHDPVQQSGARAQLRFYGQTPIQLFTAPHLSRRPHALPPPLRVHLGDSALFSLPKSAREGSIDACIVCIGVRLEERFEVLSCLYSGGELVVTRMPIGGAGCESAKTVQLQALHGRGRPQSRSCCFMRDCRQLLVGCEWDHSIKIFDCDAGELLQSVVHHRARISCLALSERGELLVLGSADTNVSVWPIQDPRRSRSRRAAATGQEGSSGGGRLRIGSRSLKEQPRGASVGSSAGGACLPLSRPDITYYEHSAEVLCVAVSIDLDLVISGARDGALVLRSLLNRQYLRTIAHPDSDVSKGTVSPIHFTDVALCAMNGAIVSAAVVFSPQTAAAPEAQEVDPTNGSSVERSHTTLLMHSMNGRLLSRSEIEGHQCQPVRLCNSGREGLGWAAGRQTELLVGLEGCEVVVRDLHDRPLHDLVRFNSGGHGRPGGAHGAPVATPKASCLVLLQCDASERAVASSGGGSRDVTATGSQLFVGLSNGQVLRQRLDGVLPWMLTRRLNAKGKKGK